MNNTVREPARDLPVSASADVVVAGGGIAGVAAALAGARAGASTLLLENTCTLGGLATAGNVTIYLPIDDGRGRVVMGGIARELFDLSVADIRHPAPVAGFRPPPAAWLDPASTPEARAAGPRLETGFNPDGYVLALEEALLRAYGEGKTVELVDNGAIKADYDSAAAILDKLNIPYAIR